MVTSLANFRSDFTIVHIPSGFFLEAREHLALWPVAILFLIMGVASPYWMRAIDPVGTAMADHATVAPSELPATPVVKVEAPVAFEGGAR